MVRFAARLQQEFQRRREKNPRYSVRAFAAFLGADHSSLSQILRKRRRVPARQLRAWAGKLQFSAEEIAFYIAAESVPDPAVASRAEELRQWTAEAASILQNPVHEEILRWCGRADFRPDCRWLAAQIGVTVDSVNLAVTRLLRLGLLEMNSAGRWTACADADRFREAALARVRGRA